MLVDLWGVLKVLNLRGLVSSILDHLGLGFPIMKHPQFRVAGWFMGNPNATWMMTGGYPDLWRPRAYWA